MQRTTNWWVFDCKRTSAASVFERLDSPTLWSLRKLHTAAKFNTVYMCATLNIYAYTGFLKHFTLFYTHMHTLVWVNTHAWRKTASVWAAALSQTKDWISNHCFLKKHKITESEERPPVSQCPNQRLYSMCSQKCAWYAHLYVMHVNLEDTCMQGRAG